MVDWKVEQKAVHLAEKWVGCLVAQKVDWMAESMASSMVDQSVVTSVD